MKKSGLTLKCCWCQKIMDTTEAVLLQGVYPIHKDKDCIIDFIATQGFLPPKPVPEIGISTSQGDSMFMSVRTGLVISRKQIAFVWKGKYVFNWEFGGSVSYPAFSFDHDKDENKPKNDQGGAVDYVGKPGEGTGGKMSVWALIILSTLIFAGCASTLEFLFRVDPELTYNNQEKKWEQKR